MMQALVNQHNDLLGGDVIYMPRFSIPRELYAAASMKLEPLPKMFDARLATERESKRLAAVLTEQTPTVNKILKLAGEKWPTCPVCSSQMLAGRRGPNDPAYYLAADNSRGFANFRCPKHGEQTRDVRFPARPIAETMIGIKGSSSLFAALPPNLTPSQDLASIPSLATDKKGGGKTK
jgi:hypothetical protein